MLPVGALCFCRTHVGRIVLPTWPIWAHLFCILQSFRTFGEDVLSPGACFRQGQHFIPKPLNILLCPPPSPTSVPSHSCSNKKQAQVLICFASLFAALRDSPPAMSGSSLRKQNAQTLGPPPLQPPSLRTTSSLAISAYRLAARGPPTIDHHHTRLPIKKRSFKVVVSKLSEPKITAKY